MQPSAIQSWSAHNIRKGKRVAYEWFRALVRLPSKSFTMYLHEHRRLVYHTIRFCICPRFFTWEISCSIHMTWQSVTTDTMYIDTHLCILLDSVLVVVILRSRKRGNMNLRKPWYHFTLVPKGPGERQIDSYYSTFGKTKLELLNLNQRSSPIHM